LEPKEAAHQETIGVAAPDSVTNLGATVRPVYGERRPMMYHLFESEMKSVSAFNGVALTCFSVSSFLLNSVIAIVIGWGYSGKDISEFGTFMFHKALWYIAVLALIFFAGGVYAICIKKSVVDQIKQETASNKPANQPESKRDR
jgi:hypothetical protein